MVMFVVSLVATVTAGKHAKKQVMTSLSCDRKLHGLNACMCYWRHVSVCFENYNKLPARDVTIM